jgi:hemin uptake protein HemP
MRDDATSVLPPPRSTAPRRLRSIDLLAGDDEIEIQHDTQVYRLRRTSLGKLILTK